MKNLIGLLILLFTTLLTVFYKKRPKKKKTRYDKVKENPKFYKMINFSNVKELIDGARLQVCEDGGDWDTTGDVPPQFEGADLPEVIPTHPNDNIKTGYKGEQIEDSGIIYSPYISVERNIDKSVKEFLDEEEGNAL